MKNPRTVVNSAWVVEPPWSFERLFFHHFERLRALRQINVSSSGYAVIGIFANRTVETYGWLTRGCAPGPAFWVFGRHSRADLRLLGDPTVALRHLVVRLGDDGSLALDDLCSEQGFDIDGKGRCRAASASGMLCARVGSYALLMLPVEARVWRATPRVAWETLEAMSFAERGSFERRAPPRLASGLGIRGPEPAPNRRAGGEPVATVVVSRNQIGSVQTVTAADLQRGLIFGRYRRCDVPVAERRSWSAVSRVHALVTQIGTKTWILDLASTNGIKVGGRRVRSAELSEPTEIGLGDGYRIYWRPEH